MTEDQPPDPGGQSSDRPDPSFIKQLEDDQLWSDLSPRGERRTDAYANRRVDRRTARSHHRGDAEYWQKAKAREGRSQPRSRRIALIVLLVAIVVVIMVALELTQSEGASSGMTPFSLLPLDTSVATSSTTSSTATGATSSTAAQ